LSENVDNRPRESRGEERQSDIYLGGVSGRRPRVPVERVALEEKASSSMPPEAYAYIAAGAGAEDGIEGNRSAFRRWRIVPRVLRDVSQRDLSIELFGRRLSTPFLLNPIGVLEMVHRDADLAVARAAAAEELPMVLSNQASRPMEEVTGELGSSPRWFQLYWSASNELVESLVGRAEDCGCEAIVVTLDTTLLGWRTRDLEIAYLPFLRGKGIAQYTSDPVFMRLVEEGSQAPPEAQAPTPRPTPAALGTLIQVLRNYPGRFLHGLRSGMARGAVERFVEIYSRPSLTWDDLPFLRARTELPILLKGVLHPDDARRAVESGIDGIVISNHGGRQVDGVIPTLEALPGIAEEVGGEIPIVFDSGVRGGADAFKALALGATAVGIGRPYVYGLAIAGEEGVREVIQNIVAEFDLTMGLAGCRSVAEIGREALALRP
jgi:lactate 2-monooxygenase